MNSESTELFIATLAFGVLALAGTALVQGCERASVDG